MFIPYIVIGTLLLFMGRNLFWLLVGVMGFIIASELSVDLLQGQPAWMQVLIPFVGGLIGVMLAISIQEAAILFSGFMAGGYFINILLHAMSMQQQHQEWTTFIIGGIVGALLMMWLFDPVLVVVSSITGSTLIVQSFHLRSTPASAVFLILVVSGIVVQSKGFSLKRKV